MGICASGCRDVDGGIIGGGDIHPPPIEHHHPVYCDSSDTVAISGGIPKDGSTRENTAVGAGRSINRPKRKRGRWSE